MKIYKIIPDFPNYIIEPDGNVWNITGENKKLVSRSVNSGGYLTVVLKMGELVKKKYLHRLLADAFIPNPSPEKYDSVGFMDKNKMNISLENLYWTNQIELMKRKAVDHPISGENHHRAILTWNDVMEIRRIYAEGNVSINMLAKHYDVHHATIYAIVNHISWKIKS